jgi:hypothetical protein
MGLMCYFGVHAWNGCKCSGCKKTRDEGHRWDGCRCSGCGKTRNSNHRRSGNDCTRCAVCQGDSGIPHVWDGCRCSKCTATRDSDHEWYECTCIKCRARRDSDHAWQGCICVRCDKRRDKNHRWVNDQCVNCGMKKEGAQPGTKLAGAVQPPGRAPQATPADPIFAVRLLVEQDEALALAGAVIVTPPQTLLASVEEELVASGSIRKGELIRHVEAHGYGEPIISPRLGTAAISERCARLFPRNEWLCCRRQTQLHSYNVVVAMKSEADRVTAGEAVAVAYRKLPPDERMHPFDTLFELLVDESLGPAADALNTALRRIKWSSTQAFCAGFAEEAAKVRRTYGSRMSAAAHGLLRECESKVQALS